MIFMSQRDRLHLLAFQAIAGAVAFARQCVRDATGVAEIEVLREEIGILRSDVAAAKDRLRLVSDAALLYERERWSDYDSLTYNGLRRTLRDAGFAALKKRT